MGWTSSPALIWVLLSVVLIAGGCLLFAKFSPLTFWVILVTLCCHSIYRRLKVSNILGKGVVITGCDSGFGHQLALRLNTLGFTVFAGCLDDQSEGAKKLKAHNIHVLQMDVTDQDQVDEAKRYVEERISSKRGLWALVNNAGVGAGGFIESHPMELYEKVASVNLFGAIRVTKAFAPLIRRNPDGNGGRIVNVSSGLGRTFVSYAGAYSISKSGLEAFTNILRQEMRSFGVKVISIQPGNFIMGTHIIHKDNKEPVTEASVKAAFRKSWDEASEPFRKDYGQERLERMLSLHVFMQRQSSKDTSRVVDAMTDAVSRAYPKDAYFVPGKWAEWIFYHSYHALPTWASDWLIDRFPDLICPKSRILTVLNSIIRGYT